MLPPCRHTQICSALCAGGLWLAAAAAYGQLNLEVGSVLTAPEPAFPVPLPAPPEVLPPAAGTAPYGSFDPAIYGPFPNSTVPGAGPLASPVAASGFSYHAGAIARAYYLNDHRVEFTGTESTFAVEGVINAGCLERVDGWELALEAQLFLNQPFDRNVLVDTPERASFKSNFDIEPLDISQLFAAARYGDVSVTMGRFVTPFGRFYFPNYRNNFDDSPFIRSEAILFRETGLVLQWDPDIWTFTAAVTNGGPQQDTNSSKALVARVGIDTLEYAVGTSIKWQDGIGSEGQKTYNNHAGVDGMVRFGPWTLSAEAIYDQYGLRRPGLTLNDITWGRSLYYRDLNKSFHQPFTGFGYYVNLGYEGPQWLIMLNYGEFYPEQTGDRRQDEVTRRGLLKISRRWTTHFETYGVVLRENDLADAFDHSTRLGIYAILGGQFVW
jgi:hypothetical protein